MVLECNRDLVLRRLTECLGRDRTKHQVAEVTSLGLVQMTRKRVGAGPARGVQRAVRALQRPRRDRARRAGRAPSGRWHGRRRQSDKSDGGRGDNGKGDRAKGDSGMGGSQRAPRPTAEERATR